MLISEEQIFEVIRRQNTWWQNGSIPEHLALPFCRLTYYEIQSLLGQPDLRRAIILSGARRVGKTVLLHQIAQDHLRRHPDPKSILYVSFEDPTLNQANLGEILQLYQRNVAPIGSHTLILLDELHYTSQWSRWLMTVLREHPDAQIVATGSAAVLLKEKGRQESAAGRWVSVHVPTLSFWEYIQIRKVAAPRLPALEHFGALVRAEPRIREAARAALVPLQRDFNDYLLQGGFPASATLPQALAHRFVREDVVDKVLKRDMAQLYGARSLGELDQIFVYLCFNSGGIVEKNTLAKELGVAAATVENHLQRLEDAHLIYRLPPIDLQGKKALKPRPKIHVADPSVRNAVLLRGDSLFDNDKEASAVVESCVFKHLYAYYYTDRPQFGYWRGNSTDKEVDFLLRFPDGRAFAFEVKYRADSSLSRRDGLIELLAGDKRPDRVYLITKNPEDFGPAKENPAIFRIPAFMFSYLIGAFELRRWTP